MSPGEPSLGHGATHSARLLISCPDGPGIVAAVGSLLYEMGANIVSSDQYSTHPQRGSFFMRVTFFLPRLADDRVSFAAAFEELAQRFSMDWRISYAGQPKRAVAEALGIPYHHVVVTRDTKPAAEAEILELIGGRADVVVLARYMQILSGDFLRRVGCPVINIHHSFLPAFAGAGPYQRANERGVKLIGATAHYVTEELDPARSSTRTCSASATTPRSRT